MILIFGAFTNLYYWRIKKLEFTRFEKARIIGARSLQISMGAPTLIKIPKNIIDPVKIAMMEFNEGIIPITVKRKTKTA